jgi:hypothetical protein
MYVAYWCKMSTREVSTDDNLSAYHAVKYFD